MKKFLLSLVAVAAILLPFSQNAQAHWGYYNHSRFVYSHHRFWHHGYWYAGCWYPGFWSYYPGPVTVVVAPY
jgi:hypothetical protein